MLNIALSYEAFSLFTIQDRATYEYFGLQYDNRAMVLKIFRGNIALLNKL